MLLALEIDIDNPDYIIHHLQTRLYNLACKQIGRVYIHNGTTENGFPAKQKRSKVCSIVM